MHTVIERTRLSSLNVGDGLQLLLLYFQSIRKQAVGHRVVVLTTDRHKNLNDRTGMAISRSAYFFSPQHMVQPAILFECKMIQVESDLILRTGTFF